jgi:hypothetical protein
MRSAEELRAEVRRLRKAINDIGDPAVKQELAARALQLSQEAEAVGLMGGDPTIIKANIGRYRRMLAAGIDDEVRKKIVEELLRYAEERLTEAARKS